MAHTEPGEERDRIFRRWLQVEMVQRLSGRRWLKFSDDEAAELFSNAHRIASRYFGEGVAHAAAALAAARRPRASSLATRGDASHRRTGPAPWAAYPRVLQVGWVDGRLQISGTVRAVRCHASGRPAQAHHRTSSTSSKRPRRSSPRCLKSRWQSGGLPRYWVSRPRRCCGWAWPDSALRLDLTERRTGETWAVTPAHPSHGSRRIVHAPRSIRTRSRREPDWPMVCGTCTCTSGSWAWECAVASRLTRSDSLVGFFPEPVAGRPPTMAAYFTQRTSGLCLDVGLVKHRKLLSNQAGCDTSKEAIVRPSGGS